MNHKLFSEVGNINETNYLNQLTALIRWSLIRHKTLLPIFTVAQIFLSIAIVYGLALLIPDIDQGTAVYLSSGATTVGIIAVGCVLAAQIVNTAKQDGIVKYQQTLPVARINILIADALIWGIASLPGVFASFIASIIKFAIPIHFSLLGLLILLLSLFAMISIGFSIAYCFSANIVSLVTQIIMIGGLLFSPITFPAERLPDWLTIVYNLLPFVPVSNLIRATFFNYGSLKFENILIVIFWAVVTSGISLLALSRRN